ncbi:hypothetical protein MA9V2_134 [Chryseobacterium phage MA9V-2]|nr:hypothetical protein MA9V2_134 [Chryseobacterium phage MA9V-2]
MTYSNIGIQINLSELHKNPDKFFDIIDHNCYTIYKVTNLVNNKSYIGDTKISLRVRIFDHIHGSFAKVPLHLYNAINKHGLENFAVEVVSYNEHDTEKFYIDKYDTWYNGYNATKDGKFYQRHAYDKTISVFSKQLDIYRRIKPFELDTYLSNGWVKRNVHSDYKCIYNESLDIYTKVHKNELDTYLSNGWILQGLNTGTVYMTTNDGKRTKIKPELVQDKLLQGYTIGWGPNDPDSRKYIPVHNAEHTVKVSKKRTAEIFRQWFYARTASK